MPRSTVKLQVIGLFALGLALQATSAFAQTHADSEVPRYAHIVVIVEENKDYEQILAGKDAPNIARLAKTYGVASQFFSEVHPSEANYVALLGGDTFGIHDDDAFYCKAGSTAAYCDGAARPGYADHTVTAQHLGAQLQAVGLGWKGYYEDLPAPGSEAIYASAGGAPTRNPLAAYYASKHSGFMNFASVQADPRRAEHIVGFDQLDADLAADALPAFALIVPNQCNEMHGLFSAGIPEDCNIGRTGALIRRGDAEIGRLVARLQASREWKSDGNMAIILTFDEGSGRTREGCCGVTPGAASNYGGGRIPTVVITNHGPHGLRDPTAYNHYSMLRTIEDAFGISEHLGHAAESDKGVAPMTKLFEVRPSLGRAIGRIFGR
jgi:phospholipase C